MLGENEDFYVQSYIQTQHGNCLRDIDVTVRFHYNIKSELNAAGNATPILWGVSNLGQSMPLKTMFTPCLHFIFLFSQRLVVTQSFSLDICIVEEWPNILMLSAVLNAFSAPLSIPHCTTQAFKLNFHRNSLKTLASLSSLCTSGNTVTAAQARRKWRTDYNRWGRKL